MTEEERAARHPQPVMRTCHRCKGTGTVGKASEFKLTELHKIEHAEWDSICPVCEGKGTTVAILEAEDARRTKH